MKIAYIIKLAITFISLNFGIFYCATATGIDDAEQEARTANTMPVEEVAPDSSSMCKRLKRSTLDGLLTTIAMDGAAIAGVATPNLSFSDRLLAIGNVPLTLLILAPILGMYSFYQGIWYDRHLI